MLSEKPYRIGNRRELFLDDFLTSTVSGDVALRQHFPQAMPVSATQPTGSYMTMLQEDGLIRCYYRGLKPDYTGEQIDGHPGEYTGYAESNDGVAWRKSALNPIFVQGREFYDKDRIGGCEVKQLPDGRFVMFYIGYEDIDTARIGAAVSENGVTNWRRLASNPIVSPGVGKWDGDACYKPSVYRDEENKRWLLWYNGRLKGAEYIGLVIHKGLELK